MGFLFYMCIRKGFVSDIRTALKNKTEIVARKGFHFGLAVLYEQANHSGAGGLACLEKEFSHNIV